MVTQVEIQIRLVRALRTLLDQDDDILNIDINERTLTHRLAIYVEKEFPNWNVDCEYNRINDVPKKIPYEPCAHLHKKDISPDETEARTVFPDIIVHKRITENNLLVIEVKKSSNALPDECDLLKLKAYKEELEYIHAAFVRIKTDDGMQEPYYVKFIECI